LLALCVIVSKDGPGELEGRIAGRCHGRRRRVVRSIFMQRLRFMFEREVARGPHRSGAPSDGGLDACSPRAQRVVEWVRGAVESRSRLEGNTGRARTRW
jgi:hypothetical protein